MGTDDRAEWLKAAAATLVGIPYDLLARGCDVARKYSDHPSKIIPNIMREIEQSWDHRKIERNKLAARMQPEAKKYPWERDREDSFDPESRCKPDEAAEILKEFGLDKTVDRDVHMGRDCSNLRQPTKEELDAIAAEFASKHYGNFPEAPQEGSQAA